MFKVEEYIKKLREKFPFLSENEIKQIWGDLPKTSDNNWCFYNLEKEGLPEIALEYVKKHPNILQYLFLWADHPKIHWSGIVWSKDYTLLPKAIEYLKQFVRKETVEINEIDWV